MNDCSLVEKVRDYLWHGYVPPRDVPAWITEVCGASSEACDYSLRGAGAQLDALFERLTAEETPPYIVPISGGWDSRLILGALRERTDQIVSVTLGCPGQLDYEVGARVAEVAKVDHIAVRLDEAVLEWSALRESARSSPWTYLPDAYFLSTAYRHAADVAGKGASIWSGFLGDPLTGGHCRREQEMETPAQAYEGFARSQRRLGQRYLPSLTVPLSYPSAPPEWKEPFGQREWLDFNVRQRGCIAPIVLGGRWRGWCATQGSGWGGVPVLAPFAEREWATYWLHAPRRLHKGQRLYRQMAEARFPKLFGLPSKYTWGAARHRRALQYALRVQHAARNRIHRRLPMLPIRSRLADNYLDFQWAFRRREDYITVVEQAIGLLKRREVTPWLDLDRIWREHYRGRRDHAQALQVLLGLAVNLEVHGQQEHS